MHLPALTFILAVKQHVSGTSVCAPEFCPGFLFLSRYVLESLWLCRSVACLLLVLTKLLVDLQGGCRRLMRSRRTCGRCRNASRSGSIELAR